WKGWAILLRQKQKKLIMLPSETMIWQPEFTDKTLSRKPGAVHSDGSTTESGDTESIWNNAAQRMKAIALETIAQEKRPGGSLNPNTQRN
ncbi:hypothetical protein ACO0KA_24430, partial [Escherichia coli]|uniref:hypothetical protein n=1 Tax=Escherichia coli TaxID=562 RepID=UPI003BF4784D